MNHIKRLIFLPAVFVLLVISSCHETDTFDGPNLIDRFGDFFVVNTLESNRATVDFSAGEKVIFTAVFNKAVNWTIVITGSESGSIKMIEGLANELNADNAVWNGGTTQLPFFKTEMVTAELLVTDEDSPVMTTDIEITGTKVYEGDLFADFEEDLGGNIFFGNFEFELTAATGRRMDMPKAAEGDSYYYFEGTDNVVSNFFVGLVRIFPSLVGEAFVPIPTSIPEELYFNSFIYSDGGPHTIAVIQFFTDTNDSGEWEDGIDQSFQLAGDYPLNWGEGWEHINHTMADVGMTQSQIEKMVMIQVLLISNNNTQPSPPLQVDFGLDFMTFTDGTPLKL